MERVPGLEPAGDSLTTTTYQLLLGVRSSYFVVLFGVLITVTSVKCSYQDIARILKWLCLALFAYVVTGFVVGPKWGLVFHDTFVPSLPRGHAAMQMVVAILGTTISPYLFVWQASQEVEELKQGKKHRPLRELTRALEGQGIGLELTREAKEFVANKGYEPELGARIVGRHLEVELGAGTGGLGSDRVGHRLRAGLERGLQRRQLAVERGQLAFKR